MSILVWAAVVWGVTMIVTTSKIFAGLRGAFPHAYGPDKLTLKNTFGTLLRCPMCFGFWVGVFFAALGYSPVELSQTLPTPVAHALALLSAGAAASAVSWTWHVVLARLGSMDL